MQVTLTQRGYQADLGAVDTASIEPGHYNAEPRNDARAETGVAWYQPATLADGRRCEIIWEFTAEEEAEAGDDPSALPWDDAHIDRIELDPRERPEPAV
jgi:hypothetical protein